MKTLFIDTNVFLSFYHLTNEDIEELKKLVVLIDKGQITLLLTDQVKDEIRRNRGNKIIDGMKQLQQAKFQLPFPAFAKVFAEYSELRDLLKKADKKHAELVAKITADAKAKALNADVLIDDLIKKAKLISADDEVYLEALQRVRLGKPSSFGSNHLIDSCERGRRGTSRIH
ncbi:putative nucleic acid-binding protein [Nitrobacteraceae bacterium AZCC 2161]